MPGTRIAPAMRDTGELWELERHPGSDELRDPGLHPAFQLFVSNILTGYLRWAPGRINALMSVWQIMNHAGIHKWTLSDVRYARAVFLDSGAITPLLRCVRGIGTPAELIEWTNQTADIVAMVWKFHEAGSAPGVVAAMDLPSYARMLGAAGLTVEDAEQITLENARAMLEAELPPGWLPVFTSQGVTLSEHRRCLARYGELGILDLVRTGGAWLAVGGMAFEKNTERIHTVHRAIRELMGDDAHIHALGVSRLGALIPMIQQGWVNSSDSSSPAQKVRYNLGPYHVQGPRPSFLWEAIHTASALYYEAVLAERLRITDAPHDQGVTWNDLEINEDAKYVPVDWLKTGVTNGTPE